MAEIARAGTLDLSVLKHVRYPLSEVNKAISGIASRNGGFTNFVICPERLPHSGNWSQNQSLR